MPRLPAKIPGVLPTIPAGAPIALTGGGMVARSRLGVAGDIARGITGATRGRATLTGATGAIRAVAGHMQGHTRAGGALGLAQAIVGAISALTRAGGGVIVIPMPLSADLAVAILYAYALLVDIAHATPAAIDVAGVYPVLTVAIENTSATAAIEDTATLDIAIKGG